MTDKTDTDPKCPPARIDIAIRFIEAICEMRRVDSTDEKPGTILAVPDEMRAAHQAAVDWVRAYISNEDRCD